MVSALIRLFLALIQVALTALIGLQRFDYYHVLLFAQNCLLPLGVSGLVSYRIGLRGVIAWCVLLNVVVAIFASASLGRLLPAEGRGSAPRHRPERGRGGQSGKSSGVVPYLS